LKVKTKTTTKIRPKNKVMEEKKEPTATLKANPFQSLSVVQPNSVTNAKYDYTAVQENVITCIVDALQNHMNKKKPIDVNLWGDPIVRLKASEIAAGKNKTYAYNQLVELRKKDIVFQYQRPDTHKESKVTTGLINSVDSVLESDFIDIEISKWAIPYILFWGKGVGGTVYNKSLALTLRGIYAKRMYKLCCRWEDVGGFVMSIDEFRKLFEIEDKYKRIENLKQRVLEPAKKEIQQVSSMYFDYSFKKVASRTYNTISFKIFGTKTDNPKENTSEHYQFVYRFLTITYPDTNNNQAMLITDELANDVSILHKAYKKFTRIRKDFDNEDIKKEDVIKLTKFILDEDFDIKPSKKSKSK
jgi:plasmid replication initiation protein